MSVANSTPRMPTLFVSHGAGPCFFMNDAHGRFAGLDCNSAATKWYKNLATQIGLVEKGKYGKPKAIIIFSAHWETNGIRITSRDKYPDLLYDYSGFPRETYEIKYATNGDPSLASRIQTAFKQHDIPSSLDNSRNFDHGVFVPLKLMFADGDIPIVQISIHQNLDVSFHQKLGKALSSVRDEGILIMGSGSASHGGNNPAEKQLAFVEHLNDILTHNTNSNSNTNTKETREKAMFEWEKIPCARMAHAREEHFIPLMPVIAAADFSIAERVGNVPIPGWGLSLSSWLFP